MSNCWHEQLLQALIFSVNKYHHCSHIISYLPDDRIKVCPIAHNVLTITWASKKLQMNFKWASNKQVNNSKWFN